MRSSHFTKRSQINAPVEDVFQWHARPGAIERLSPPWDPLVVLDRTGGIRKGDRVILKMKAGPFPFRWYAEHTGYEENRQFRDCQTSGPFSEWIHTHLFDQDEGNTCRLEDRIEYRLPFHPLTSSFIGPMISKKLKRIFKYRHTTTRSDIHLHQQYKDQPRKNILISGASGLIGSALVPFLTTGGHNVISLVRRRSSSGSHEIAWNPVDGYLDLDNIANIDAIIHLAGENISGSRWTKRKKKKIHNSRVKSTTLLVEKITSLKKKPDVFISASAIGFYGNRGDAILCENDKPGDDFLSDVCAEWEKAAAPAADRGIRTACARIGVVLTPQGGALMRMLFPFSIGMGGRIGTGRQYMSWIGIDDVIGSIYHILMNNDISGPVNLVSPSPVTNNEFMNIFKGILSRPALLPLPVWMIKQLFGEMGKEILLSSTRVKPEKLLETGYVFRYPQLEKALKHILGRG